VPTKRNTEPKQIIITGGGSSSSSSLKKPPVEPGIWAPYGPTGAEPDILPGKYFNVSLNYILTFYLRIFFFSDNAKRFRKANIRLNDFAA
jgi:hypothetical protein